MNENIFKIKGERTIRSKFVNFFRKIKWCYQRCTRGYADIDWFDMSYYIQNVIPSMLRELAVKGQGYPIGDEFKTYESWEDYLLEIARHFENSREDQTVMENNCIKPWLSNETKDTEAYKQICKDYFLRDKEIHEWQNKEIHKAFEMMAHVFWNLWD